MSFQVGETVGRYRIIEQLGQGGMATVFKAYHAELDRFVALKVLHPAFLEDSSFLARFQREARLVAKIDHPNIVPIYDYAEHEGRPYLVMKFIEGETLKARLERGQIPQSEIQTIVEAVGAALSYAHKQGILHRDMKPSNVLLADDGHIYLADFGLARIAQSGESTLTSDMILGTPQYISPEQALGKKDLDEGTDIYSFGVMLYELVVGKVPFSADTPFSIIHDHIYSPLPMPHTVNPAVSEDVERVLLKTLSKERGDRYKDVKSLVAAFVEALLASEPSSIAFDNAAETILLDDGSETVHAEPQPEISNPADATVPADGDVSGTGKEPRKQRKIPWMWLAVAVVLFFGCLIVLGALRSIRSLRQISTTPTEMFATNTAILLETPASSPEIDRARQEVNKNPDDPSAHLQLAFAYLQGGMSELGQDSITQVIRLAGSDEVFLWDSARVAASKGSWLSAARLASDAAKIHLESNRSLPPDLGTLLHETVYKAMKNKLAAGYLPFDQLAQVDEPLSQLAKARYTFYFGDKTFAQQMLDELNLDKPGFAEAQLLQAEISSRTGDPERARQALADMRANPGTQDWMLQEADIIEGTLP
jgi:serine/threonine protein kinase